VLAAAARTLGDVRVVAPDREQSASSHSLTMHFPLRAPVDEWRAPRRRHPDGLRGAGGRRAAGRRPDFVLSGVNHGPNMGEDVLYSGTVAGAMEATILGIPAVAFSYAGATRRRSAAYGPLLESCSAARRRDDFPPETLLNVNLPAIPGEVRGVRVTRLGRRVYTDSLTRALDPSGREYFWIGGGGVEWNDPRAPTSGRSTTATSPSPRCTWTSPTTSCSPTWSAGSSAVSDRYVAQRRR
jgi:5'-nucleotidase